MTTETTRKKKGKTGVPNSNYVFDNDYINIDAMCAVFGRSPSTIYRLVAEGKLPKPMKFGCQNLWDAEKIKSSLKNAKFTG